jgi:hypothetical protein
MPEPVEPGDFEAYLEEVSTAFHHDRIRLDAESFKPQCDPVRFAPGTLVLKSAARYP